MEEINNFLIRDVHAALTIETLPARASILATDAGKRCEKLHSYGIRTSTDLCTLMSDENALTLAAGKTGIDANYLSALNHELRFRRFKPVPMTKLEDVKREHIESLGKLGIKNTGILLLKCKTAKGREEVSRQASVPRRDLTAILGMADLMREAGVKAAKTRLFMKAGINSLKMLGMQDPREFRERLESIIDETGIVKAVPTPKEIASDIAWAKLHPSMVEGL